MRTTLIKSIDDPAGFSRKLLLWSQQFREAVYLDSNQYPQKYGSLDVMLAADALTSLQTDYHDAFKDLAEYQQITKDWLFGYLSYDLKNDTERLISNNFDGLHFPDLFFFQPKKLFKLSGNQLEISYLKLCDDEIEFDFAEISQTKVELKEINASNIKQRISKPDYLAKVEQMQQRINLGDIYEANFCMEFYAEDAVIDPVSVFFNLNSISQPPFAAYLKNSRHFIMSASPERYIRKEDSTVISQPIKGTARRSSDPATDEQIKSELLISEKERSENIMIVDLVRNDLSKTAEKGSVNVEELCGAYIKQVHHLISTVTSTSFKPPVDILKSTFPMGSMTGAPKISAMEIIEELEETKRGVYSGAIGYFSPSGDFDFNVVIRSILYNQQNKYLSFSVGSAITSLSDPEKEYAECLLKAAAMRKVLTP